MKRIPLFGAIPLSILALFVGATGTASCLASFFPYSENNPLETSRETPPQYTVDVGTFVHLHFPKLYGVSCSSDAPFLETLIPENQTWEISDAAFSYLTYGKTIHMEEPGQETVSMSVGFKAPGVYRFYSVKNGTKQVVVTFNALFSPEGKGLEFGLREEGEDRWFGFSSGNPVKLYTRYSLVYNGNPWDEEVLPYSVSFLNANNLYRFEDGSFMVGALEGSFSIQIRYKNSVITTKNYDSPSSEPMGEVGLVLLSSLSYMKGEQATMADFTEENMKRLEDLHPIGACTLDQEPYRYFAPNAKRIVCTPGNSYSLAVVDISSFDNTIHCVNSSDSSLPQAIQIAILNTNNPRPLTLSLEGGVSLFATNRPVVMGGDVRIVSKESTSTKPNSIWMRRDSLYVSYYWTIRATNVEVEALSPLKILGPSSLDSEVHRSAFLANLGSVEGVSLNLGASVSGGSAISAESITLSCPESSSLRLYGGNGGNGAPGEENQEGDEGKPGWFALVATTITIQESPGTIYFIGGKGGDGGKGGKGNNGKFLGPSARDGAKGGDGGKSYYGFSCTTFAHYGTLVYDACAGTSNGGEGGDPGVTMFGESKNRGPRGKNGERIPSKGQLVGPGQIRI